MPVTDNDDQKTIKNTMNEKQTHRRPGAGGPHGLGDPDDKTLRKVEMEIMIPKKMRAIAKNEFCAEVVAEFTKCCQEKNILFAFKCRKENAALKDCLTRWYSDEKLKERCKNEYLEERSEYRRTGITQKQKRMATNMS